MVEIKSCLTDADYAFALRLTRDYIDWLKLDLAFQNIDAELARFSSMYGPPYGLFLLAWRGDDLCGGVGLRRLEMRICEMKRLFVYDAFKGQGMGYALCTALIREAVKRGYEKMRLDTLQRMRPAIKLYQELGFEEIAPYCYNPEKTAKFMELDLSASNLSTLNG